MKKLSRFTVLAIMMILGPVALLTAQGVKIGDTAPGFQLKNIDGKVVGLDNFKDEKGVIVIFTCNHCPFSIMYEQRILDLDKEFSAKGWPVVAINPNDPEQYPADSYENMKKQAKKMKYTFPYLLDDTQEIAKAYGATRTPHVFLLERTDAGFTVRYIGAIDDNAQEASSVETKFLNDAIEAVSKGKDPEPAETKAIGCGIKWKKA